MEKPYRVYDRAIMKYNNISGQAPYNQGNIYKPIGLQIFPIKPKGDKKC